MDIGKIKSVNDERDKALAQLTLMYEKEKSFNNCWYEKLKNATDKFLDEFINFFKENGWEVKKSSSGNEKITVTYGMDSYFLKSINYFGRPMVLETGKDYSDTHYFSLGQKQDDPNYINRSTFEVNHRMLTLNYGGTPNYEEFLKRFAAIEDLKHVEEKAREYMQRMQKNMALIDKVEFYIIPTDEKTSYDCVKDYISSI